jgi:N-hydroxyarylamine O-acetyltransferase
MDGGSHAQFQNTYRVAPEGGLQVLQSLHQGAWKDLYAFLPAPCFPIDFEVANHYTSTHPESRFVRTLTVQLPGRDLRRILRHRTYTELRGDAVVARELAPQEVASLLEEVFRIGGVQIRND